MELTLALYQTLDLDHDRVIWMGHQAYPHKPITGRFNDFDSLRQQHGVAGYFALGERIRPLRAGHASTSISAALGMAMAGTTVVSRSSVLLLLVMALDRHGSGGHQPRRTPP